MNDLSPAPFSISPAGRRATARPRDAAFYQNPYAFYSALHLGTPTFLWEDYGHWCFTGFKEVNALLRDKRFGREILHVMTRDELGWPPPKAHTAAFDLTEKYSLLALEPPAHTRLRTLVNRAFVSRNVEQLRPRIERLANEIIDGFAADGGTELIKSFAAPIPAIIIAEMIGLPGEMAPQLLNWSNRMVQMYMYSVTRETELDANQASADFMAYLRDVIAERRKAPKEDLLTHMLVADQIDGQ
jgi:cytochrome P450